MEDFVTGFGRRQDALKTLYTEVTATTEPPNRPLGNVDMVGNILIDLHHRLALLNAVMVGDEDRSIETAWQNVRELAEYEWALIGPAVIEKLRQKKAEATS